MAVDVALQAELKARPMLERPTFRKTWLPLGLAALALAILNLGMYTRLASQQVRVAADREQFTLPYREDFTTVVDVPYEEFGGDWEIRDQRLVQLSTSGYDLTAFIPLTLSAGQDYRFEAGLTFLGGSMGGGLLFNAQQVTSRQQSHMARFNVDAGQLWLIYGYFGDDSDFVGQGSVGLSIVPDDTASHRLGVQTRGATYMLTLDGVILAQDIPLQYQGGAVGFISATSQMAFDDVLVDRSLEVPLESASSVPEAAPAETLALLTGELVFNDTFDNPSGAESDWRPISGTWAFAAGAYLQQQAEGFDLSAILSAADDHAADSERHLAAPTGCRRRSAVQPAHAGQQKWRTHGALRRCGRCDRVGIFRCQWRFHWARERSGTARW